MYFFRASWCMRDKHQKYDVRRMEVAVIISFKVFLGYGFLWFVLISLLKR